MTGVRFEAPAAERTKTTISSWSFVRRVLNDPEFSSSVDSWSAMSSANNLLFMDGADHRRLRNEIVAYLASRDFVAIERAMRDALAASLTAASRHGTDDLMKSMVEPIVFEGLFRLLGVDDENRFALRTHTCGMHGLLEPDLDDETRRRVTRAAVCAALVFERDAKKGSAKGLHAALEKAAASGTITQKSARTTPVVLLHGGYENPVHQLGSIIAWACEDPSRFRAGVMRSPRLVFDHVLSRYSPVRALMRRAKRTLVMDGVTVPRDRIVWLDLQAAHADLASSLSTEGQIGSGRCPHLGFGHGSHICIGASLARLQGKILIEALCELPDEILRSARISWNDGIIGVGPTAVYVELKNVESQSKKTSYVTSCARAGTINLT